MITIYNAKEQIERLKEILDTEEIKNELDIPLTEKDDEGNDLFIPNEYGVCEQSPFFLMTNFLPQLIINVEKQQAVDQQFNTADMYTDFALYYCFEHQPHTPTNKIMAEKLQYIAKKLLEHRTAEENNWITMSLPTIEIVNEVHKMYEENQIPIAVGRVSFNLHWKGVYR